MAWPDESGWLGITASIRIPPPLPTKLRSSVQRVRRNIPRPPLVPHRIVPRVRALRRSVHRRALRSGLQTVSSAGLTVVRYRVSLRDQYTIFNTAEFRFYKAVGTPPLETDTPFDENATLPYEPAFLFLDGQHFLSVSYFNGVQDSGFLPIGPNGETYLRLEVAGGLEINLPPQGPTAVVLTKLPNGVIRIAALYVQTGVLRGNEWAVAFTTDGSTPATDTPTITKTIVGDPVALYEHDLPAQADGTTVTVRVQIRRLDSGQVYSENSTVVVETADAVGPVAPAGGTTWKGALPEEL